jgi:hypothetical protein
MNRPLEDWPRLASYVVSARLAAGFRDRRTLSVATGVTDRTLGKLENGKRVSPDTLAAIELAVGWKPDSARQILAGGEPSPVAPAEPADPLTPEERQLLETYREAIRAGTERQEAARREGNGRSA